MSVKLRSCGKLERLSAKRGRPGAGHGAGRGTDLCPSAWRSLRLWPGSSDGGERQKTLLAGFSTSSVPFNDRVDGFLDRLAERLRHSTTLAGPVRPGSGGRARSPPKAVICADPLG